MEPILHVLGFIVALVVIVIGVLFAVADSAARLEFIRDKFPGLERWLEKRSSIVYLLVVGIFLQAVFLFELISKEVPEVPTFKPPAFAAIPAPIIQEMDRPVASPVPLHESSLRDRANKLANELQAFMDKRDKQMSDFSQTITQTPEQQTALRSPYNDFIQETYKMYTDRFSIRVVTIVQEFKALGLDVSSIERCAATGICSPYTLPVALHALAARLDDNGNVRR